MYSVCNKPLTLPGLGFFELEKTGGGSIWPAPHDFHKKCDMEPIYGIWVPKNLMNSSFKIQKFWVAPMAAPAPAELWRHPPTTTSNSHNFAKNFPIFIIFSPICHILSLLSNDVSHKGVGKFFGKFDFYRRTGAWPWPVTPEKFFCVKMSANKF